MVFEGWNETVVRTIFFDTGASNEFAPFLEVHIFAVRGQHFFATKNGWGREPWGYMQNPIHR